MGYLEDKAKAADFDRLQAEAIAYKQRQEANRQANIAFKRAFEQRAPVGLAEQSVGVPITQIPYHDGVSEEAKYILNTQPRQEVPVSRGLASQILDRR